MPDKKVMQQALEALENAVRYHGIMLMADPPQDAWKYHRVEDNAKQAITALRESLAQSEQEEQQQQENPALIEWKEKGEEIMAQAGIGFHLGAWWADRPWRQR